MRKMRVWLGLVLFLCQVACVTNVALVPPAMESATLAPILPTVTSTPTLVRLAIAPPPATVDFSSDNLRTRIPSSTFAPSSTLTPSATRPAPTLTPFSKPLNTPVATRVFSDTNLFIHLPPQANQRQPLRVLYVLHGFGSKGEPFAQGILSDADRNNWVVVAPTMAYQDYLQIATMMDDDLKISQMLLDTLDDLPRRLNLKLDRHVLVYGFSRGAQLAHRFALLHPDRVGAVASLSAGSYTLPLERYRDRDQTPLPFPFGVNDLEKFLGHSLDKESFNAISFWIAVGERDNQAGDVARQFDPYGGVTRIERARNFANILQSLGVDARFVLYPNTGHEVTPEMRQGALKFLRDDELKDGWN